MQKIMPKTILNAEELELHYPSLLTDGSSQSGKDMQLTKHDEFKLADIEAINKVCANSLLTIQVNGHTHL
jgi:hypothetical protein